jgi:hypothetical protein
MARAASVTDGSVPWSDDTIEGYDVNGVTTGTGAGPCWGGAADNARATCWAVTDGIGSLRFRLGATGAIATRTADSRDTLATLAGLLCDGTRGFTGAAVTSCGGTSAAVRLTSIATNTGTIATNTNNVGTKLDAVKDALTYDNAGTPRDHGDREHDDLAQLHGDLAQLHTDLQDVKTAVNNQGPNPGSVSFPGGSESTPSYVRLASSDGTDDLMSDATAQLTSGFYFLAGLLVAGLAAPFVRRLLWP